MTAISEKRVWILRGLPGSGKSTRAREIVADMPLYAWRVHNTDSYHYQWVDGVYKYVFDAKKLPQRHDENFVEFCKSVARGIPTVVVDNTNTSIAEYERYFKFAHERGYTIIIETVGSTEPRVAAEYAARNVHGVPEGIIRAMARRFEPTPETGLR